ncbi:barstar family protein [Nocardia sp. NPDC004860]|uniref:barstar family protein n=1 Tax=Nocardia sp. NPDC004860 TaxID=3154557 RepID=UPI0033AF77EB
MFTLDGQAVTDIDSFYCALGEAINGPGGYFGWNLDALVDCLRGGWGATSPFTLKWLHSDEAQDHLAADQQVAGGQTPFELLFGDLAGEGHRGHLALGLYLECTEFGSSGRSAPQRVPAAGAPRWPVRSARNAAWANIHSCSCSCARGRRRRRQQPARTAQCAALRAERH